MSQGLESFDGLVDMKARTFNSVMNQVNKRWAAEVLNMDINPCCGADLIKDNKLVELKFAVLYPFRYTHKSWRVLDYQLNYGDNGKHSFWGLGFYTLKKEVGEINTKNSARLESFVEKRELYIVKWQWMSQFPIYHQHGETAMTKWDNNMIFPKARKLPKVISSYPVEKGLIHITEEVPPNIF